MHRTETYHQNHTSYGLATCAVHPGAGKSTELVLSEDDNCSTLLNGPRLVVLLWQH